MSDKETLFEIIRLKERLAEPADVSDSDEEEDYYMLTNRGNKLKRGARGIACTVLNPPGDPVGVRVVDYHGHKQALIYKRSRPVFIEDEADLEGDSDYDPDEPQLLDEVKLDDLLKPITDPAEVPHHPAMSRAYTSDILQKIARESLDIIVDEKDRVTKLANLLSAFLGDDSRYLNLKNLEIPEYNTADDAAEPVKPEPNPESSGHMMGITSDVQSDANGAPMRPNTRQETNKNVEPFFAVPEVQIDCDYGVSEEAAEDARQLLQVAHQRMEEFVRCMTEIRMGLTRADRLRRQVLAWCREMNNEEYVEGMEDVDDETSSQQTWQAPEATDASASGTERFSGVDRSD
ncbi:Transcriptional regulatory protein RXT2 [Wickerhamiella sorbophila]|uniref:Transcriptional regulatory protein RXT2 n=1 Tax=Wickerhamiella sorbophila TaxID=45607 RepID=A0A2T0FN29_9ASCO|nr:Transcriptional regulatory protein RXT2 [Wickerhamiella sorbophila]PRT56377.1 Transcriptional regulatory protein RXT2 [Wickerhamiella sorbophila]